MVQRLADDVQRLPRADRVVRQPAALGTIDLSGGAMFARSQQHQDALVTLAAHHYPQDTVVLPGGQPAYAHAVLRTLLRAFTNIHNFWRQTDLLNSRQLQEYDTAIVQFGRCWQGLGWKATVWVHWTVAHSGYFMARFRTLALFSSVPTEKRHQTFKKDMRHSFQG